MLAARGDGTMAVGAVGVGHADHRSPAAAVGAAVATAIGVVHIDGGKNRGPWAAAERRRTATAVGAADIEHGN